MKTDWVAYAVIAAGVILALGNILQALHLWK